MMFTCPIPECHDLRCLHHAFPVPRKAGAKPARAKPAARATRILRHPRNGHRLRVDLHCHYLNTDVAAKVMPLNPAQHDPSFRFANALTRDVNAKQIQERGPKLSDVEVRLADMDRMGIDIQAVSPAPNQCYYWTEPGLGVELARLLNDRLAEIVATWPDRFVALGTVPLQDASLAVSELERCVKTLGMRGVEILPNLNGMNLSEPRAGLDKFFAKVQELDVVIFMHPMGFTQGERLRDHYFINVIGNPLETTVAASHLIFDGVMERYPRLKIVLPHAGGFLGHYWARMDHAYRARADCRTGIRKSPSTYLAKFYFDTIAFDPLMLRHLVDKWGAEHVVLGTDYPYDMGEENPLRLIRSIPGLSAGQQDKILGGNAAQLLKIKR